MLEQHRPFYFASLPPYTYSMMIQWLESIAVEEIVSIKKIGISLGGLDIPSIIINGGKKKKQGEGYINNSYKPLQAKAFEVKSFSLPNSQKIQVNKVR